MKIAEDWCEEMFGRNNWVVADCTTIRAIQADALKAEVTLTILQIKELAQFAGLQIVEDQSPLDDMEFEVTVSAGDGGGVIDDDGKTKRYSHIAFLTEYPEEGVFPLGAELTEARS